MLWLVYIREIVFTVALKMFFCLNAGPIITSQPLPQIFIRGLASRETACVLWLLLVALHPALSALVSLFLVSSI